MIVRCDQCSTKFRLDDAKVKDNGVKVRCSKCKHVFVVYKEVPHEESEFEAILGGLGSSVPAKRPEPEEKPLPAFNGEDERPFSFEDSAETGPMSETPPGAGEEPSTAGEGAGETSAGDEKQDYEADFDFGSFATAPGEVGEEAAGNGVDTSSDRDETGAGLFAFTEEPAAPQDLPGFQPEPISTPEANESKPAEPPPEEMSPGAGEPCALGAIDWGEPTPAALPGQEPVDDASAGKAMGDLPAPPESASPDTGTAATDTEEPPFPVSSRRKGTSLFPILVIAISVLFIIALAGTGFYFLDEGPAAFNRIGLGFLAKWVGLEAPEAGKISIRNPLGAFMQNQEAGEIFVIRGEAVNDYRKPRASVQVKVTLYGAKGEPNLHKTAYCGNSLSKEQLATLPMAKIEAAMNNQFGDSLSNLGVQPGKGIPFVVVFAGVPKEAVEYGVEVVGSTVASQ